jgi:hypothetical protein
MINTPEKQQKQQLFVLHKNRPDNKQVPAGIQFAAARGQAEGEPAVLR